MRETLPRLLNKKGDLNVCGVSASERHVSSIVAASGADVVILDSITARYSDGTVLPKIITKVPNIKVVLIAMDDDPKISDRCVRPGALTCLPKDVGAAEVCSAVLAAARGHAVYKMRLDGTFSRTAVRG